jgi:hypothetical protein
LSSSPVASIAIDNRQQFSRQMVKALIFLEFGLAALARL